MEKSKETSLAVLLHGKSPDEAAEIVLKMMRHEDPKILNLCDDDQPNDTLSDIVCQYIAEQALKEILDTIKSQPITTKHLYSSSVLVAIKDLHVVKKYLWKDKGFVNALESFLKFAQLNDSFVLLRDIVAHLVQTALLGGTPSSFFETICKSELIELYTTILKNKEKVISMYSYEEMLLSLMLLCQNNKLCVEKCSKLSVSQIITEFSQWSALDSNLKDEAKVASGCIQHMVSMESLPDHKKFMFNKFSEHIHSQNKNKNIVCCNPTCGKEQNEESTGRYKKCGRCRVALYCSKDCQIAHWKNGHSKVCVSPT